MTWGAIGRRTMSPARIRNALRAALIAALAVIVTAPVVPVWAEQSGDRIDRAAKRALSDSSIQKVLPGFGPGRAAPRGGGELPPSRVPREDGRESIGSVSRTLLWAFAIVAGLALLFFVFRELRTFRRGSGRRRFEEVEASAVAGQTGDGGAPRDRLLEEADALAARGDFGEAIHLILMHSLRRLERAGEQVIGRSLTAREIVRGSRITARAREPLGAIVGASEITHFGGRPADARAYQGCREAYREFSAQTALETGAAS